MREFVIGVLLVGLLSVFVAAVFLPEWAAFVTVSSYIAASFALRLILGGRDEDPNLQ